MNESCMQSKPLNIVRFGKELPDFAKMHKKSYLFREKVYAGKGGENAANRLTAAGKTFIIMQNEYIIVGLRPDGQTGGRNV